MITGCKSARGVVVAKRPEQAVRSGRFFRYFGNCLNICVTA